MEIYENIEKEVKSKIGTLILIGGNEKKSLNEDKPILNRFVQEVGEIKKQGKAVEVVIAELGSDIPSEYLDTYKKIFQQLDLPCEMNSIVNEDHFTSLKSGDKVKNCFFIPGGDQARAFNNMGEYGREMIADSYRSGTVIAGTSAGASLLGEYMITGTDKDDGDITISSGLGLLENVIVDQHFSKRNRIKRLKMALREIAYANSVEGVTNQAPIGLGIDEDTAIVIKEGHEAEVIGSGKVTIVRYVPRESSQHSDDDFDITILEPNTTFDLDTFR